MILSAILHWIVTALVLLLVSKITPGVHLDSFGTALIAALVLGLVNFAIRPILTLLTLPLTIVTLGLFAFVVNAMLFGLVAWLVPGFEVHGFLSAVVGAFLLTVMTMLLDMMFTRQHRLT